MTKTIVSLVVAEVPIGAFLYLILGELRRLSAQRMHDALAKTHAVIDFSHLRIFYSEDWKLYAYPRLHYYVVNLATKLVSYFAPDYVHELEVAKVIRKYYFEPYREGKPFNELEKCFKEYGITLVPRFPFATELVSPDFGLDSAGVVKASSEALAMMPKTKRRTWKR